MTRSKNNQDAYYQEQRMIAWMSNDLEAGFEGVVQAYQAHLKRVADNLLGATPRLAHLAEDIVQDGLLKAYLHLQAHPEMLNKSLKLRAWLSKIVYNLAMDVLKTGEARLVLSTGLLGCEVEEEVVEGYTAHYHPDPLLLFERLESIREAKRTTQQLLGTLPPDHRMAVERMYLAPAASGKEKRTYREVAKELGRPEGTVKAQVTRSLKRMRSQLSEQQNGPDKQRKKTS